MEETQLLPLIITLFLFVTTSIASETSDSVTEWVNQSQSQKDFYLNDAQQLKENAESQIHQCFAAGAHDTERHKSKKSILIFVSLSMPKESLKNLYKEAEEQNLPLIIRGLKNNSFKETAEAIRELEISVQIDPNLFEEHEIKMVPTFVMLRKNEPLKIKGNISLSYALKKLEAH